MTIFFKTFVLFKNSSTEHTYKWKLFCFDYICYQIHKHLKISTFAMKFLQVDIDFPICPSCVSKLTSQTQRHFKTAILVIKLETLGEK